MYSDVLRLEMKKWDVHVCIIEPQAYRTGLHQFSFSLHSNEQSLHIPLYGHEAKIPCAPLWSSLPVCLVLVMGNLLQSAKKEPKHHSVLFDSIQISVCNSCCECMRQCKWNTCMGVITSIFISFQHIAEKTLLVRFQKWNLEYVQLLAIITAYNVDTMVCLCSLCH